MNNSIWPRMPLLLCAVLGSLCLVTCVRDSAGDVDSEGRRDDAAPAPETAVDQAKEIERLDAIAKKLAADHGAALEAHELIRGGATATMLSCDIQEKMVRADGKPSVLFCKIVDLARSADGWVIEASARHAGLTLSLRLGCDEAIARRILEHRDSLGDNAENGFALVASFDSIERPAFALRPALDAGPSGAALRLNTDERAFLCRGRCAAIEHVGASMNVLF
ncbi:MAG TPA: hypothetical protein PLU30_22300 [Verrucomicrobiae bacterium]|nr:hypothetical protein [Verrucomicrobiae bacterium]